MIFGLEQEGGSLIALMALAHPLHPIHNRSRNKHRNLWVGRCVSSWWPWFPSRSSVLIIYICMGIPYMSSVRGRIYIQRECHSVLAKLHRITFLGSARFLGWMPLFCFLWFTNCVLLFDISLILGCLWPLVFVLNNSLILGIWCSTIPHLQGCFCPWTFFENIGFNTVLTDPLMSHLATQLRYSAGEFQALQLIVLAAFVWWINHLPPACWSTFWKSNFKQQLSCRFDIMDNKSYFVVFRHMQLNVLIHQIIFRFYLLKYSLFFQVLLY